MRELLGMARRLDLRAMFWEPTENGVVQFFRYAFVGGVAAVVDWAVLWLIERMGAHYLIAAVFAFFAGLATNFALSKLFVFRAQKARLGSGVELAAGGEFLSYAVIGAVGLGITAALMYALTEWVGLHFMLSKVIATLIVLVWNFMARKLLLYRGGQKEQ